MRSTFPATAALMVLALALTNWPSAPHSTLRTAAADDNSGQSTSSAGTKSVPFPTINQSSEELTKHIDSMLKNGAISMDFTGQPLNEVMDYVHDKFPDLQVYFDDGALKDAGIDKTTTLITIKLTNMRLETALHTMLGQLNLGYRVHDGLLIIATKEKLDSTLETRIYDCRDLLLTGAENFHKYHGVSPGAADAKAHSPVNDLIQIITSSVRPQTWTTKDGPCTVDEYSGLLVINQTHEAHSQLADLLDKLSAKLKPHEKMQEKN